MTGAPAELVLSTSRVDRSSTTDLAEVTSLTGLDISVTDLDKELFSVGLTDSA